jgi:hypothetical protein
MKTLSDHIKILEHIRSAGDNQCQEVDDMKKMKINTQIDLYESDGLWNTESDRWSRRAKHHFSQTELRNASNLSPFEKGDIAVYEGRQVEVRIPNGPNSTIGVMLEGHLKMVNSSKLCPIDESINGVMGGLKPMEPLNRIMQLAGLEVSGAVSESEIIEADGAGTMFDQLLVKNQNSPEFRNNPAAAKVATIGQVLAGLQSMIQDLPMDQMGAVANQIRMVPGIGANLIDSAKKMTKPSVAGAE